MTLPCFSGKLLSSEKDSNSGSGGSSSRGSSSGGSSSGGSSSSSSGGSSSQGTEFAYTTACLVQGTVHKKEHTSLSSRCLKVHKHEICWNVLSKRGFYEPEACFIKILPARKQFLGESEVRILGKTVDFGLLIVIDFGLI